MSKFYVGQKVVCIKKYTSEIELYAVCTIDEVCNSCVENIKLLLIDGHYRASNLFEDFDEWTAKQPKKEIMNTLVPHIHEKEIIAWAKGETVQVFFASNQCWVDCLSPVWGQSATYRIKPKINYPETLLTENEIIKIANECNNGIKNNVVRVANAILKHAIDNNQVFVKETT